MAIFLLATPSFAQFSKIDASILVNGKRDLSEVSWGYLESERIAGNTYWIGAKIIIYRKNGTHTFIFYAENNSNALRDCSIPGNCSLGEPLWTFSSEEAINLTTWGHELKGTNCSRERVVCPGSIEFFEGVEMNPENGDFLLIDVELNNQEAHNLPETIDNENSLFWRQSRARSFLVGPLSGRAVLDRDLHVEFNIPVFGGSTFYENRADGYGMLELEALNDTPDLPEGTTFTLVFVDDLSLERIFNATGKIEAGETPDRPPAIRFFFPLKEIDSHPNFSFSIFSDFSPSGTLSRWSGEDAAKVIVSGIAQTGRAHFDSDGFIYSGKGILPRMRTSCPLSKGVFRKDGCPEIWLFWGVYFVFSAFLMALVFLYLRKPGRPKRKKRSGRRNGQ